MTRPIEPQSDERAKQLLAAAVERQKESLVQLAHLYRDSLRLLATRQLNRRNLDQADASSAVQESMLRVVKHADRFEGRSLAEFESWLITILTNIIRDRHRRFRAKKREKALEVSLEELDSFIFWQRQQGDNRNATAASIADDVDSEYLWQVLRRSLEKLPPHYQAVFRSYYEHGETVEQIAERLESTKDAVRGLIRRVVKRLKLTAERELRQLP